MIDESIDVNILANFLVLLLQSFNLARSSKAPAFLKQHISLSFSIYVQYVPSGVYTPLIS